MKIKGAVLSEAGTYPTFTDFTLSQEGSKVIVPVLASALNHRDVWIKKGMYAGIKYPIILGSDAIVELDDRRYLVNPGSKWGDIEAFQGQDYNILGLPEHGTFASHVAIDKSRLQMCPGHLNDEEAAALPLAGLTAYRALFKRAQLAKRDKVFISGIGGGVALFAMQMAIANGNEVYVSSSSEKKIEKAIALGASGGYNYKDDDMHKQVLKSAGPMDVVIDSAGGPGFGKLVNICNKGARISIYGGTQGKLECSPQKLFWNQISILGSTMGSDEDFKEMIKFVNGKEIKPVIDTILPLKDIAKGMKKMESGKQFGKIVFRNNSSR